jgi:hypothetical protein
VSENNSANSGTKADSGNDDHHALYNLVFVIAGGLVTAVVEFALLWSDNHHLAFLAMAASLSLLSIYQTRIWGWDVNWIMAVVFCWFAVAQIANAIIGPNPEPTIPPVVGWIQPANDPTPSNGCDRVPADRLPKGIPIIILGTNGFAPNAGASTYDALQIGTCMPIEISQESTGLAISADIFSTQGKLIGKLRKNGYTVAGDKKLVVEKTGDLSTLVVHDEQGTELLYVRYVNSGAIRVRGVFSCPTPRLQTVVIANDRIVTPGNNAFGGGCIAGGRIGMLIN